jgi:hypothetical protein
MKAAAVLKEALAIVEREGLPDPAMREVMSTLASHPPESRSLLYEAASEAGLQGETLLSRCAGVYFGYCAGHLAEDLIDGTCSYLSDPRRTGPALQFLLQSLFFETVLHAGVERVVVEQAAHELVVATGRRLSDLGRVKWRAQVLGDVADPAAGRHCAAWFRILWHGTPLAGRVEDVGYRLGAFMLAGGDMARRERRFSALPAEDQREVLRWLEGLTDDLRASGLRFLDVYLGSFEAMLRRAHDEVGTRIIS